MSDLIAFYTDEGVPTTGLSPTISVWQTDGTQVVNEASMTEIAGGFYFYDFSVEDVGVTYVFRTDSGGPLSNSDRFKAGSTELNSTEEEMARFGVD